MRNREDVRVALDRNFKALMDCVGRLTEDELTSCAVAGKWTVKDVIAHEWSWIDEAVRTVKAWQSARPWQDGVAFDDAWNEAQVSSRGVLPLINVVDGFTGAHRRLMTLLDLADDNALQRVARAPWGEEMSLLDFIDSMGEHYGEHVAALQNYQEHCLQSDCQ